MSAKEELKKLFEEKEFLNRMTAYTYKRSLIDNEIKKVKSRIDQVAMLYIEELEQQTEINQEHV